MANQDSTTTAGFTAGETKFLLAYIKHLKSNPDVDWVSIAQELDYDKVNSAKKYYSKLKIKHGLGVGSVKAAGEGGKKRRAGEAPEGASPSKKSTSRDLY